MEEPLNGIKGLEKKDKAQFPGQAKSTVHEKLSRVGIEDNYGYENREIFQEGREKTDLINKPEDVVAEEKINSPRESTPEFEKAIEWTDTYLSDEVVDKYALSYVKNKKSSEDKRRNNKYGKYLAIANNELKPRVAELLEKKIKDKVINSKESDPNKIKNEIAKILNSEMHATLLLRVLNDFKADKLAKEERNRNDFGEKASLLVKDEIIPGEEIRKNVIDRHFPPEDPKNSGESREDEDQLDREMKERYPNIINSSQGFEPLLDEVDLESALEPAPEEKTEEEKLKDDIAEAPKTEKEFFKKFERIGSYFNPIDNSEFQILGYDPDKKEVTIYRHQSFVYDKETDSWGAPEERGKEEILKYEDFLKLTEGHISDLSLNHEHFKEDKVEIERGKSKEKKVEIEEKKENDMEKLNELEKKLVDIFRGEVSEYEKKAEQWVREIFSEELWDINKKDLIVKWIDKTLSGLIKEALENNNIKDASVEKVINNLKLEIVPGNELAEKIKNDIKSLLEKF